MSLRPILACAVLLTACNSDLSGDEGVDAGARGRVDGGGFIDASPETPDADTPGADAQPSVGNPDAGDEEPTDYGEATVTAENCLFLRQGPSIDAPKVPCDDAEPECYLGSEVCIPAGETVQLTGEAEAGSGCSAGWYPLTYKGYSGYSCGTLLDVPGV